MKYKANYIVIYNKLCNGCAYLWRRGNRLIYMYLLELKIFFFPTYPDSPCYSLVCHHIENLQGAA